jgi:hypothetical protein
MNRMLYRLVTMKVQELDKEQDQSVLADFYESPEYKSLRGVIDG